MSSKRRGVPIDGIAIRDRPEDLAAFLATYGDPFDRIGADPDSRVQFALGSSGVPRPSSSTAAASSATSISATIEPERCRRRSSRA